MAEGLKTADGQAVDVPPAGEADDHAAKAFAQAMNAPEPDAPMVPSPPKTDPDAPYGRTKDGKPKRGPGGRPPKAKAKADPADRPRVQAAAAGPARDYTEDLTGIVQLSWGVLAGTSPADAAAVKTYGPGMVSAWNTLAQENRQVARGIEWLTSGSAYGAVVMATAPLVLQVLANHRMVGAERFAGMGVRPAEELAAETMRDVAEMAAQTAQAA